MDTKFLKTLQLSDLEELKDILEDNNVEKQKLLEIINETIKYRKDLENGELDFSSDRMIYMNDSNQEKIREVLKKLTIDDFLFLEASFKAYTNRRRNFPFERISEFRFKNKNSVLMYSFITLDKLDSFFEDDEDNKFLYEGVYNTLNYIKEYIGYCLDDKEDVSKEVLFSDYEKKKDIVSINFLTLGKYFSDMREGTKLQLSIGNSGFKSTSTSVKSSKTLTYNQMNLVSAVAFGTSLEKLEEGNYEDCKRLLFLPREKK